jgi:hypothetical protein
LQFLRDFEQLYSTLRETGDEEKVEQEIVAAVRVVAG